MLHKSTSKRGSLKKRRRTRNVVSFNNTLVTKMHIVNFFTTGRSKLMCQKIAELGMASNQEPGAIDWEVIPDAPIHDDPMDVDSNLNEWKDIFEENTGPKGMAVTRLQTIISCALFSSLRHISVIAL